MCNFVTNGEVGTVTRAIPFRDIKSRQAAPNGTQAAFIDLMGKRTVGNSSASAK